MPLSILILGGAEQAAMRKAFHLEVRPEDEVLLVPTVEELTGRLETRETLHLVALPDSAGLDLNHIARLRGADPHVPVVVVAERRDYDRQVQAMNAGATDVLVAGERLRARIATLLGRLRPSFDAVVSWRLHEQHPIECDLYGQAAELLVILRRDLPDIGRVTRAAKKRVQRRSLGEGAISGAVSVGWVWDRPGAMWIAYDHRVREGPFQTNSHNTLTIEIEKDLSCRVIAAHAAPLDGYEPYHRDRYGLWQVRPVPTYEAAVAEIERLSQGETAMATQSRPTPAPGALPRLPATYLARQSNTHYELKLSGDLDAVSGDFRYSRHTAGGLGTEDDSEEGTWSLARPGVLSLRVRKTSSASEYGFHDRDVSESETDRVIDAMLLAGGRVIAIMGRRLWRAKREAEEDEMESTLLARRARSRAEKGDTEPALQDFAEAIRLAPRDPYVRCQRGSLLNQLGRGAEALADYDEAVKLKPDLWTAWYHRGLMRRSAGDLRGAAADLAKALRLAPSSWAHHAEVKEMIQALRSHPGEDGRHP